MVTKRMSRINKNEIATAIIIMNMNGRVKKERWLPALATSTTCNIKQS